MANDKLQSLTSKLYAEGLAKGREEGERILSEARAEAEKILSQAREKADRTIADASAKASDILTKTASDVKLASSLALQATKSDIENAILTRSVDTPVEGVLSDEEFVKTIILEAARRFSAESACDLSVVIPQSLSGNVEEYVRGEVAKAVGRGIEVELSKKIKGGFRIGPGDGSYFVSLTDETFTDLIREYLRPITRKTLFGE